MPVPRVATCSSHPIGVSEISSVLLKHHLRLLRPTPDMHLQHSHMHYQLLGETFQILKRSDWLAIRSPRNIAVLQLRRGYKEPDSE